MKSALAIRAILPGLFMALLAAIAAVPAQADEPQKRPADDPMIGKEAGQLRDDNGLGLKLIWCPGGVVRMEQLEYGADDQIVDSRKKGVFLTHGYWLGKYETTQAEWKQLLATEPWKDQQDTKEGADYPATWVDWDDATRFCVTLTKQERKAGRLPDNWEYSLPTEAQWERACRARTETTYSFGNDESQLGEYAWFLDNALRVSEHYAHRVGQKRPNPWGLHDMHGNVSEWCRDHYVEELPGGRDPEVTEPTDPKRRHVDRGGRWYSKAYVCASAVRHGSPVPMRVYALGFRVALVPVRQAARAP